MGGGEDGGVGGGDMKELPFSMIKQQRLIRLP